MPRSEYSDVLTRVRAWAAKQEDMFDIWSPRWSLEREVPGALTANGNLSETYVTQVLRAVNALVTDGSLVKIGTGRDARYWTPQAYEKHVVYLAQLTAESAAHREAWHRVKMRLAALGYPDTGGTLNIQLGLETWQRLLSALESDAERSWTREQRNDA